MAEYIEREKAIKEINDAYEYEYPTAIGAFDEFATTIVPNVLLNQPAADVVEVRHGEWIKAGTGITERIVCSHCHSHKGSYLKPPFCSQCGAKMDGERRKEDG